MTPEQLFAAHVTSATFQLSLSKAMIACLVQIANGSKTANLRTSGLYDTVVMTCIRLEARGLIHAPDPQYPGRYEITEVGKLVIQLLQCAGLVEAPQQAEAMP